MLHAGSNPLIEEKSMDNFRMLKLNLDVGNPEEWLASQSADVRLVTTIENGSLYQTPIVEQGAYVDPSAQLIGGIIVRSGCYIGPYAVVRLDEKASPAPLILGEGSNLQDFSIVHSTSAHIGRRVIVAHQAIVHGALVEDNVTIYIQSVVDGGGTVIGEGSFLHQGVYVGKGIHVPSNRYIAPGSKILNQAAADALPEVTDEIRALSQHVLELNDSHVERYLEAESH
jgi:carbonic anhydrase/acetyltransferase-like protein (isoleucine patch superfamily)